MPEIVYKAGNVKVPNYYDQTYKESNELTFVLFKIWPFSVSFSLHLSFQKLTENRLIINFADDWIRTEDLWYSKRLPRQLSPHHCPLFAITPKMSDFTIVNYLQLNWLNWTRNLTEVIKLLQSRNFRLWNVY